MPEPMSSENDNSNKENMGNSSMEVDDGNDKCPSPVRSSVVVANCAAAVPMAPTQCEIQLLNEVAGWIDRNEYGESKRNGTRDCIGLYLEHFSLLSPLLFSPEVLVIGYRFIDAWRCQRRTRTSFSVDILSLESNYCFVYFYWFVDSADCIDLYLKHFGI